jgi:N6-L-threonylcarbamoyladenine synthase
MNDIDAIAICAGPGLAGALIVGVAEAKSLAMLYNKPVITVNHMNGHLFSCNLESEPIEFPALALLISGGHTELRYMRDASNYEVVGETLDDALGETFDKLSKMIGGDYPGGPVVEKRSLQGENIIKLNIPKNDNTLDFSFSGLKSQMSQMINNISVPSKGITEE